MSTVQTEIHDALKDIQKKVNNGNDLSDSDMELLFLTALIEEEA